MTGLRSYERDASLPGALGDPACSPLSPEEAKERIEADLLEPWAPPIESIRWSYARWKPEVSITCGYGVRFVDGVEETVVWKRYRGDKARYLEAKGWPEPLRSERTDESAPLLGAEPRLRPYAVRASRGSVMWSFPSDRLLPGLALVADRRRLSRFLEEARVVPPRSVRRRRMALELLRYKPERRAVLRLDLALRGVEGREAHSRRLAVRLLPAGVGDRTAGLRRTLEAEAPPHLVPHLLAHDDESGLTLEEWWDDIEPLGAHAFEHAEEAGTALALLHRTPCPPAEGPREAPADLRAFAHGDVGRLLARAVAEDAPLHQGPRPAPAARTWIHGDFHPDQVVRRSGTTGVLDLDLLDVGDPARDLSSWIADHLAHAPDTDWARATEPLLRGYRSGGGTAPREDALAQHVAADLVLRAAAMHRRLEAGARERAPELLRCAHRVRPRGGVA